MENDSKKVIRELIEHNKDLIFEYKMKEKKLNEINKALIELLNNNSKS